MTNHSNKNNRLANAFAQQLLMPKNQVKSMIRQIAEDKKLDSNAMSETDARELISSCAIKFGVSYAAMNYRVKTLEIFTSI